MNALALALARAQVNYDNRLPPDSSIRESAIEARTEQLAAQYWQDPEFLTDALSDAAITIGWYRKGEPTHPDTMKLLGLLRDGSDDLEAVRLLRKGMRAYLAQLAADAAAEEMEAA